MLDTNRSNSRLLIDHQIKKRTATKMKSKLPKLKAFKMIRKTFVVMGIGPTLATQSYPLNGRIMFGFLLLCSGTTFSCVYIFNDAETFSDYTQSVYILSAGIICTVVLIILILKVEKLFDLINRFDSTINMSKWKFNSFCCQIHFNCITQNFAD